MGKFGSWWSSSGKGKKKKKKDSDSGSSSTSGGWYDSYGNYHAPVKSSTGTTHHYSSYDDYYDDDYYDGSYYSSGYSWSTSSYKDKYRSSLGWSSGSLSSYWGSGSYYSTSSYSTSGDDINKMSQVIKKAYDSARDLLVILDLPFTPDIQLTVGYKPQEGHRRIFIPTSIFDDDTKSDDDKISIYSGLGVHEGAHLKYTEYKIYKEFCERAEATIKSSFLKQIIQIVEAERVDDKLLTERPGYSDFINLAKNYNYECLEKALSSLKDTKSSGVSDSSKNKIKEYFLGLASIIHYPEHINEKILETYIGSYNNIREILTPGPETTKDACVASLKIYGEVKNCMSDILKVDFEKSDPAEMEKMVQEAMGQMLDALSKLLKDAMLSGIPYGMDEDGDPSGDAIVTDFVSKILQSGGDENIVSRLITGRSCYGKSNMTYFNTQVVGDKRTYDDSKRRISKYIPGIRNLIRNIDKNYDFSIYGCRNGKLDTNKLPEAYQGVPQVYIRQGHVRTNKTTVCVLIDESGSMGCHDNRCSHSRYIKARDAAVLLNEALGSLPGVDLYIYGHTADVDAEYTTTINIYREGNKVFNKYSLSEVAARCQNRDGTAIFEAANRVRKFTQNHCLMFVISDGEPAAGEYYGREAIQDVKNNVNKVQNTMNMDIVQVSIAPVYGVEQMFDKYIDITDGIDQMPKLLGGIIKKYIAVDKKTTVS